MRRMVLAGITTLLATAMQVEAAEDFTGSYFCTEEFGGGIAWDVGQSRWESTTFRPEARFVLKLDRLRVTSDPLWGEFGSYSGRIVEAGTSNSEPCTPVFRGSPEDIEITDSGLFNCWASLTTYRFSVVHLRYSAAYQNGFVDGRDNDENTPSMTGGHCTKID